MLSPEEMKCSFSLFLSAAAEADSTQQGRPSLRIYGALVASVEAYEEPSVFVDMFPLESKASGLHKHDTGNTTPTDIMNVASEKEIVCPVHVIFLHVHVQE